MSLSNEKKKLENVFKNCLDILRNQEAIVGDKAMRNLSFLIIFKMIEQHIGNKGESDKKIFIDDDSQFDLSQYSQKEKEKIFSIIKYSNLIKEKTENLPTQIQCLWSEVLSVHPATKSIFQKDKSFDIKKGITFKMMFEQLNKVDLQHTDFDVLGNAYEEVIKDVMTGKIFGQFFTQPIIKNLMVQLIDPHIDTAGRIESVCDPAMGTGGFLITYLKYIKEKGKSKNIELDWNHITNNSVYGKEISTDTFQLAMSNLLISSGHIFNLQNGDSLANPIEEKFDNVLANPPFGIDINYNNFKKEIIQHYLPIPSNNAVCLFLQAIIYMLKVNGKCAVVVPVGEVCKNKKTKSLVECRRFLLQTCELKEVIQLPSGIFTNAGVNTCIFYFVKKTCQPNKLFETKQVKFYDFNFDRNEKTLICSVDIDQLKNNDFCLYHGDYTTSELENEQKLADDVKVERIADICTFLPKSKRQASFGKETGTYPFFTSSQILKKYCEETDYNDECIVIGTGGNANIKYCHGKFSCSTDNFILKSRDNSTVSIKYVFHYLLSNIHLLQKAFQGYSTINHLSKEYLQNLTIPIPPLNKQQDIIDNFIEEEEMILKLQKRIEQHKKNMITFLQQTLTN